MTRLLLAAVLVGTAAGDPGAGVGSLPTTAAGIDSLLAGRTARYPRPLPVGQAPRRSAGPSGGSGAWPDSVIRDDFVVNDDVTGGCRQASPAVAVGPDGSFTVSWHGFTAGEADVWFQRFDAAGRPLGANRTANGDSGMYWQGDPAVTFGSDGSFILTWEDRWEVGNSDIFAQRFAADGSERGRNFRVSDSVADGDQMVSGIRTSPAGLTFVAWDDRRLGLTGDIFAQFLDSTGVRIGDNFRVNDDPPNFGNQYDPAVGGDDAGRFVVAWMDGRSGNWDIYAQRFGPDRARLGSNLRVTPNDSIQWSPGLGVSPSGRFLVTWEDRRRAQWDVYAQVYDTAGQPVGEAFRVNDDAGIQDQFAPCAAGNRYDEFLVVWADRRGGYEEIGAQRYRHDGVPLGANFLVSAWGEAPAGRGAPAAAARPDGGYVVVWADGGPGDLDIYARLFDRNGNPSGLPFRVNSDTASSLQRVSSLDLFADGRVLVAWEDERSGRPDIYSAILAPDGAPAGANRRLNDDAAGVTSQYYAAASAGRSRALVTWTDGRDGYNVVGQFLDSLGTPAGGNFVVNSETSSAFQWYSYSAMDDGDRAMVVWMDSRGGQYRIMARRFGPDGRPQGDEFPVSDNEAVQYYGSVAVNRAGRGLATWMDYRGGGRPDIYCRMFDSLGVPVGSSFRANDNPGDSYHGYPVAALAEDGSFAVAWEDTRNGDYDVYLQWFSADRTPVGGNVRVNDGPPGVDAYSPSCDFDRQGRLVVLFNDERDRPGSPDILCQRFRSDRTRISGNQRLTSPREGPRDHHWTVGRSIAVSDDVVAATWTGNRRLQGWDVYAKLTDWNLIGLTGAYGPVPGGAFRAWPTVVRNGRLTVVAPAGELTVYDKAGRVCRRIARPAGQAVIDVGDLPRGVYFLESSAAPRRQSLKLVIP
jgi:hypothetical protein